MSSDELSSFPVDDATLLAIEHALGGALTMDRPADNTDWWDDGPWLVGADYSLHELMDFLAACSGKDPNEQLLSEEPRVVYDTRIHYSEHDIIRALIAEVRRLRDE